MPPGKKTKNTLACVFTVANVLGTWERYHRPLLIYRYEPSRGRGRKRNLVVVAVVVVVSAVVLAVVVLVVIVIVVLYWQ